jgi:TATA-box binding protein (TBP) (component of TFIID and TFIIIB)
MTDIYEHDIIDESDNEEELSEERTVSKANRIFIEPSNFKNFIDKNYMNFTKLPKDLSISTMSATCKLGCKLNLKNIYDFIDLKESEFIFVRYGKDMRYIKYIKKKCNTSKKMFFNQITLIAEFEPEKMLNIKLFINGSMQITGCKNIEQYNKLMNSLITQLTLEKATIENGKIIEKPFVEDRKSLGIYDFKIDMINSNFSIGRSINLKKYRDVLIDQEGIPARYDPIFHASVSMVHLNNGVKLSSILVFDSGNIIITGVKSIEDLLQSYTYINNILMKYKKQVMKIDLNQIDNIIEFLKQKSLTDISN